MTERLYTDIHNHLYPPGSDGPLSISESIECIRELVDGGFGDVVFTPHFSSIKDYNLLISTYSREKGYLKDIPFSYTISVEYLFDPSMFDAVRERRIITLKKDNPHFLVEVWTPFIPGLPAIERVLVAFYSHALRHGYRPILAHPERNFPLETIVELKDAGYIIQVNLGSLLGMYGIDVMRRAEKLIENKIADCLATDAHDIYTVREAVKWIRKNELDSELISLFKPTFLL